MYGRLWVTVNKTALQRILGVFLAFPFSHVFVANVGGALCGVPHTCERQLKGG